MKSVFVVIAAVLLVFAASGLASAEDLDFKRVHLMDYLPQSRSLLFRSNAPIKKDSKHHYEMAYDELMNYTNKRAQERANVTLKGKKVYLVDISFEVIVEGGQFAELEFFKKNPSLGEYIEWILVGDLLWPNWVSAQERKDLILNGTIWKIDHLPTRLLKLRAMLEHGPPAGYDYLAVVIHCAAGCDRTGEFSLSYYITYRPQYIGKVDNTFLSYYKKDCSPEYGCGRCPSSYSSAAAGWYCLTWNMFNATSSGRPQFPDCITAYDCKPFSSHCVPSNTLLF